VLLLLLALAACGGSDHAGLRDWSMQARETVLPLQAPRGDTLPPDTAPRAGRAEAVLALQDGAAAWLATLAALADDAPAQPVGAGIVARAARVAPFDAEGAAALAQLGQTIDYVAGRRWGAAQLAYAIDVGDPPFQASMAALGRQAAALSAETPALSPQARAVREARLAAIARIAAGHALVESRKRILAQAETSRLMRAEAAELRRLTLVPPPGATLADAAPR
jgi:hypothetical protein